MFQLARVYLLAFLLAFSSAADARPLERSEVPPALAPWVDWVLQKHPDLQCPVNYNNDERRCVWPGSLDLTIEATGATFSQELTVLAQSRIRLPGDKKQWPLQVKINDQAASVIAQDGHPAIDLAPGKYRITGTFRWQQMPNSIRLAPGTGIVRAIVNQQPLSRPDRRDGRLWLRKSGSSKASQAPEDDLDFQVARQIADGHPLRVTTELTLRVSGKQREVDLPHVMLKGGIALQLISKLPARLEANGSLKLQIRPGTWSVRVIERHIGSVDALTAPAASENWPASETWVWRADPQLRIAELLGPSQIDPRQVELPRKWQQLPAYQVAAGQVLQIKTVRRGDPTPEPDQLSLSRQLWLDFDGGGYTSRDQISGRMTSTWRLNASESLALGQVTINGRPQFITRSAQDDGAGVEVRRGRLSLVADSRIGQAPASTFGVMVSTLPAIGWLHDFQKVSASLHTPPGWRVLAVSGVDSAPGAWLQAWTLYDLFLLLVIAVAAGRLWGWPWAFLSAALLALLWHEPHAPKLLWLAALIPVALLRVVPAEGRLSQGLQVLRALSLIGLVLAALPFVVQQARIALHPQLESTQGVSGRALRLPASTSPVAEQEMAFEDSAAMAPQASSMKKRSYESSRNGLKNPSKKKESRYVAKTLSEIDPEAIVQTGPGIPDWNWRNIRLNFNGPVLAGQTIKVTMLSPGLKRLAHALMLVLLALMLWRLIGWRRGGKGRWRWDQVFVMVLAVQTAPSEAAEFPPNALLKELETRLLENPIAAPRAAIAAMDLTVDSETLSLGLVVNSLQRTALPLPVDKQRLMPVRVTLNGEPADQRLLSDKNGQLWILVPKGRHELKLTVPLPPVNQFELTLPLAPSKVNIDASDWTVSGVDANGVPGAQLTLIRKRKAVAQNQQKLTPLELPPLLSVTRTLRLGITWELETIVRRLSPRGTPISITVPLIDGEQVITDKMVVRNKSVLVRFGARSQKVSWRSRLETTPVISLTAPDNSAWTETWRLEAGLTWRVQTSGIAPVFHQDRQSNWLPTWKPWSGESVTLNISKPVGIGGQSMTIDKSRLTVTPGSRASDSSLEFTLRASQGGQHEIALPDGAVLQTVRINGKSRPVRQGEQSLVLPIVPGSQKIELKWRQNTGVTASWQGPVVDLGQPHVNARIAVSFPQDRWALWTSGPTLGPAVLIWGVLSVLLVISFALSKAGGNKTARQSMPLGMTSWFLLGIGLTQVSTLALIVPVLWLFLLKARPALGQTVPRWAFNGIQLGIVGLTVISLAILLWAVEAGLLGQPDMQIRGYGSQATQLNWYLDRSAGLTPQVGVVSAPLWVYRLLMLLWALWLAWSLLNWLRWGWGQFSDGGLWRPFLRQTKPTPPPPPAPTPVAPAPLGTPGTNSTGPSVAPGPDPSPSTVKTDLASFAAEALKNPIDKKPPGSR